MTQFAKTQLGCPRCEPDAVASGHPAPPLYRADGGGVAIQGCGVCGGVFLGRACADRLATSLPADAIALALRAGQSARHAPNTERPLACPMCKKTMSRTRAAKAQVDLDVCASCGTWYDRDEIRRITDAIRSSGWGGAAVPVAAGVAGAAAVAATTHVAAQNPTVRSAGESALETGVEVGVEAVSAGLDAADVLDGVFSVLGAFFD